MRLAALLLLALAGCVPDADEGWDPVGPLLVVRSGDATSTSDTGDTGDPGAGEALGTPGPWAPAPPGAEPR